MLSINGYNSISIVGLGLIGGSIAKAIRDKMPHFNIKAYDIDRKSLDIAYNAGIISKPEDSIVETCQNANIIIIATNIASYPQILQELHPIIKNDMIITDIGSVKQYPSQIFKDYTSQFVPGHPIAGKETSGIEQADTNLFANKKVILTPNKYTLPNNINIIIKLWESLGARCKIMSAYDHDNIYAHISHIPQAMIFCENDILDNNDKLNSQSHLRLANSNRKMWQEIFTANCEIIIPLMQKIINRISSITNEDILKAKQLRSSFRDDLTSLSINQNLPIISYLVATILVEMSTNIINASEYVGSGFLDSTKCLATYESSKWSNPEKDIAQIIKRIDHHIKSIKLN